MPENHLQITAHYTPQSIQEAADLNRRLWRRALRLATTARAFVYLIAGLWLGFALLALGLRTPARPLDTYAGAVILFAVTTLAVLTSRRRTAQIQKAIRAKPDQQINIDFTGLTIGSTHEPWSAFASFHEGKSIVSLARPNKAPSLSIPTDTLTPTQTGELRSILLIHLPEQL